MKTGGFDSSLSIIIFVSSALPSTKVLLLHVAHNWNHDSSSVSLHITVSMNFHNVLYNMFIKAF